METWFFGFVQSLTGNPLIDQLMIFSAEFLIILVPLTLVYLWFQDDQGRLDSVYAFTAVLSGLMVSYVVLAQVYQHNSPFQIYDTIASGEPENGFPSQHTTVVLSMVLPLIWQSRKKLAALFLTSGVLTGFSRIYIGEHFLIDILGAGLAASIGFAATLLIQKYLGEEVNRSVDFTYRLQKKVFSYLPADV
jgi:undecaprenyl-diphosphatase